MVDWDTLTLFFGYFISLVLKSCESKKYMDGKVKFKLLSSISKIRKNKKDLDRKVKKKKNAISLYSIIYSI